MTPTELDDLKALIIDGAKSDERSQQIALGPSEVGHPCLRKLALGLLHAPKVNNYDDPLPSVIGTGAHSRFEEFANRDNARRIALGQPSRWLTEHRVTIREGLAGTCDLYDMETNTVIDWKGLDVTTPIPTPSGWTTIGALSYGDAVFAADGTPCTVTAKSPVFERPCYRIVFEDGASIVADNVHLWNVILGDCGTRDARTATLSTSEVAELVARGRKVRVANPAPLSLPFADLPIRPYVLGSWLGDGESATGRIGSAGTETFDHIAAEGYVIGPWQKANGVDFRRNIVGLAHQLRLSGLIDDKHIPLQYLRASHNQRLALLQGLMDTDGTWNRQLNQAVFTTTSKSLARQVAELVTTLGWRSRTWELTKRGFGLTTTAYDVAFVPFGHNPFRLSRKAQLVRLAGTVRARRRVVRSVDAIPTVPTQCISVDSIDQTFLCGYEMIPTHNCPGTSRMDTYRRQGPSETYRRQAHLYGRGWRNLGLPVEHVGICFLPRGGQLKHAHLWTEPYSDAVVDETLARIDTVTALIWDLQIGEHPERINDIPATPDGCWVCPYKSRHPGPFQCMGGKDSDTTVSAPQGAFAL